MTKRDKIILIGAFGAAILAAVLQIGIREWYAPDVRYGEGSYYISGTTAITSLKLTNDGHSDAEDIIINSSFNRPIIDISTDDQSTKLAIISGGKDVNYVSCKIDRLVPGQELYIFYAVNYEKISPAELNKQFISKITFKGGKGKPGSNPFLFIFGALFGIIIGFIVGYLIRYLIRYTDRIALNLTQRFHGAEGHGKGKTNVNGGKPEDS